MCKTYDTYAFIEQTYEHGPRGHNRPVTDSASFTVLGTSFAAVCVHNRTRTGSTSVTVLGGAFGAVAVNAMWSGGTGCEEQSGSRRHACGERSGMWLEGRVPW